MNFHTSNNEKEGVSNISQFDTPPTPYENCPYENGTLQAQKIANLPVQNTLSVTISAAITAFRGIFVFLPSRHTGNLYNCISKESGYYEKEKD